MKQLRPLPGKSHLGIESCWAGVPSQPVHKQIEGDHPIGSLNAPPDSSTVGTLFIMTLL